MSRDAVADFDWSASSLASIPATRIQLISVLRTMCRLTSPRTAWSVAAGCAETSVMAACLVRASTEQTSTRVIRNDSRSARSPLPGWTTPTRNGMECGGITPIGLPPTWPILIDDAVAALDMIVIGSGIRGSQIALPGQSAARLPNAEILALALSSTS